MKTKLPQLKEQRSLDFVVASGDGATGGFGIGKNHSIYLHKLGVDAITSGECIYYKKDMVTHIAKAPYMLRAANYPYGNPGRGWHVFSVGDSKVGVVNLLGQSGFNRVHLNNPFLMIHDIVAKSGAHLDTQVARRDDKIRRSAWLNAAFGQVLVLAAANRETSRHDDVQHEIANRYDTFGHAVYLFPSTSW